MMNRHWNWRITSGVIASLVFLPLFTLVWLSASFDTELWLHLANTVLADYIISSLSLMLGVAILTLILGVGCAFLVTQYQFKGVVFFMGFITAVGDASLYNRLFIYWHARCRRPSAKPYTQPTGVTVW